MNRLCFIGVQFFALVISFDMRAVARIGTDGPFILRLVESDSDEWSLEVMRDSIWQHFDIPLSLFGSGSEFLNTPVTKLVLVPVGGGTIGGPVNEVSDWIDDIVLADTLIDDFEDGEYSDWHRVIALNGSYLDLEPDSATPNASLRCLKIVHGNSLFGTFAGWMEKSFAGLSLLPSDTLRFWLRGVSYLLTDVDDELGEIPRSLILYQNYPNPFNPETHIKYSLPSLSSNQAKGRVGEGSHVTLKVYDLLGREVTALVDESLEPGSYRVSWDASDFPSGVYFYRLTAGSFVETKRCVLLK